MTASSAYNSLPQGQSSGWSQRLLVALVVFLVILVLALLLPTSIPVELSLSEMTQHGPSVCQSCPPTEQLVAAGMMAGEAAWYLNVRFASPPFNSRLRISFAGIPGVLEVQQTGKTWLNAHVTSAGLPALAGVSERDNQVVFVLPDTLRTNGFTVSTASGDRIPVADFIEPVYPKAAHFNGTDVVLLLILAVTAWFGYKRGLVLELSNLAAILLSILLAALLYRPLAAWCAHILPDPRASAAAVSCALVLVAGSIGLLLLPKLTLRLGAAAGSVHPKLSGALGGGIACLRQLAVLAMLLAVGTDLTVLHWANSSINSSVIGTALLHAWRTVFFGT